MKRADILMVTAVWGEWHLDVFLTVNLPTLLAPGNLPALVERHGVAYHILTRAADVDRIRGDSTFQRLAALVRVDLRTIEDERQLRDPIAAHVSLWRGSIDSAKRAGQFAFLMPPDVLWSDGSLAHVGDLIGGGMFAVMAALPRVASNSFLPTFRARFGGSPEQVAMTGRDLMGLCLAHLHPLMAAHARASRYFAMHPEMVVWPVAGEGLAVRVFCRELMVFDPNRVQLNELQLVDDPVPWDGLHMVTDSDRLFAASLAPLGKDLSWQALPHRASSLDMARWSLLFDSPVNDYTANRRIRWHTGAMTEHSWQAAEVAGDLLARRIALERETLRVITYMARHDVSGTTELRQLLALSLLAGRMARALRGLPGHRDGRTGFVFLPADSALAAAESAGWSGLLAAPGAKLERIVRDHVALGRGVVNLDQSEPSRGVDLEFLSGRRGRLRHSGAAWMIDEVPIRRVERVSAGLVLCYTRGLLRDHRTSADVGPHG